ncbi:MAG: substrate-binding periplasmic protein [Elsteraceae bacterium]
MTLTRRRFAVSIALSALGLRCGSARAEMEWEALTVGYYEIPPYLQMVNGKLAGLLYDTWNDLTARVGVTYVPVSLPPARLVKSLADGDVDVSMTPITFPEFIGKTLFSKRPAANIILEAYNFWPAPKLNSLRDLNGRSVILQQGFGYGGLINYFKAPENRITIAGSVPNPEVGMRMLEAGRADFLLHYRPSIQALGAAFDFQGLQATVLSDVPIHVVLSKSVPNSAILMARFDAAIEARLPPKTQ